MRRYEIRVRDLDMPATPVVLSAWLASEGDLIVEGDRVAEILAGEALVDVESPATGLLTERLVAVDQVVAVGQVIGVVVARE